MKEIKYIGNKPKTHILNPEFRYKSSDETNLRVTFAKERMRQNMLRNGKNPEQILPIIRSVK